MACIQYIPLHGTSEDHNDLVFMIFLRSNRVIYKIIYCFLVKFQETATECGLSNKKRAVHSTARSLSIIRRPGHLIRREDHLLFPGQFLVHLGDDQAQMPLVADVIQVIRRDGQHRAKLEARDPVLIQ